MKHLVLSLMLVLATVFAFPLETFAQDIPDDDGEEIEITVREGSTETGSGRFLYIIPFNATLFRSIKCIEVEFLDNIGEVTISLTNHTKVLAILQIPTAYSCFAIFWPKL